LKSNQNRLHWFLIVSNAGIQGYHVSNDERGRSGDIRSLASMLAEKVDDPAGVTSYSWRKE
jgi:hypothetical protein